jgi:hypothetical protein
MKRYLMTLILSGLLGSLVLSGNANACHLNKCRHTSTCCAVVTPPPCPPPAPVCQPACRPRLRLCGGGLCGGGLFNGGCGGGLFKGFKLGCHRQTCAPAPCGGVVAYTGTYTGVYSTPQTSAQH